MIYIYAEIKCAIISDISVKAYFHATNFVLSGSLPLSHAKPTKISTRKEVFALQRYDN